MRRVPSEPRPDWQRRIEAQGLVFGTTDLPDGGQAPYWFEGARYELTLAQVEELEEVTEELHGMCVEVAHLLASGATGRIGLPPGALELAKESLAADPPSLLGRFDLRYDGRGPAKLLEYNADTPTGLLESAVVQWYWLQDTHPELDQWNSLHERLVAGWANLADRLPTGTVYFAYHEGEPTGEEFMTTTYLRDTCDQAGLPTAAITMGQIGYDPRRRCFVGAGEEPLRTCFKLYPWEHMLAEDFGAHIEARPVGVLSTTWIEPPWKVLLSNKALLAALWRLYPDHPNLLPAYLEHPGPLESWVAKPLHGREGDNIRIHAPDDGVELSQPGDYGAEGWCYQQWAPLPDFDGNKAVLGSWVVDGHAAGVGIRESDGWVTDYYARFVPHLITAAAPSEQERADWLADTEREAVQDVVRGRRPDGRPVGPQMPVLSGPERPHDRPTDIPDLLRKEPM